LVIVVFLLAVAAISQILRRWTVVMAWLSAAATGAVGLLIALVPLDEPFALGPLTIAVGEPFVVLGRELVIQPVDRLPLAFISFTASILFLIAWRLLPHSNFFPVGVAIVALLSAALTVQQVVYAALFVEMAAILGVFPLQEPQTGPEGNQYGRQSRGGLQYLTYATLALPGLMITQLLLEQFAIFPSDLGLLRSATILLGLSFAILLGAVPFQSWLSTVATDGSPPVVTFLFTVNLGTVWFLLLAYLETYQWLGEQAEFASLFTSVGLLMMVIGGALAASQRRLGRIVGYATLVDNGAMFVALGTRQVAGVTLTLIILMARPLALGLTTLGLDGLRRFGKGRDDVEALTGAAWRVPWPTLAFMVGGIAMAGFPLSLGFSARWGLYRLMAETNLFRAIMGLSGSAGVMMGLVNAVRFLLAPLAEEDEAAAPDEDPIVLFLTLTLIVSTFLLGIFPQLLSRVAFRITQSFTFFGQ
jgi:formate hydrogenlyase subunit 3/multisubunit Na+/H+ antiporter MnhD subunit